MGVLFCTVRLKFDFSPNKDSGAFVKSIGVNMSPASDNISDKHMRKCAQTYKRKEPEGRREDQGNMMMIDSTRDKFMIEKLEKVFF